MAISRLIKYEGDNSTFIWKYPHEDFNCFTQIIVHQSQQAIFVRNGRVMDVLGPGRHKLNAKNIPILTHALNLVTGISVIHCEVYFVNMTVQMGLKWGTDTKVRFVEPTANIPVELGASGEMNLQVSDGYKLLVAIVGTMKGIAWEQTGNEFTKSIQNAFRALIGTAVKTSLPAVIRDQNIDIIEIDSHLNMLSAALRAAMEKGFVEYGLTIPQLYVTTVVLPEDDANFRQLKELHTVALKKQKAQADAEIESARAAGRARVVTAEREVVLEHQATDTEVAKRAAERKVIHAQADADAQRIRGYAEAEVMRAKGYTQKDVFQTEVQKAYAEGIGNMGGTSGSTVGDIIGLGIGMQAAGAVGEKLNGLFTGASAPADNGIKCAKCGNELPANAKFCLECGAKVETSDDSIICPSCGQKTPKGKFCISCGATLIRKCPQCGVEITNNGKFCLECGAKLF